MIKITFEKKKSPAGSGKMGKSLFKVLVILLGIVFAINLLLLIVRIKNENYRYVYEYSSLADAVEDHDFAELETEIAHNKALGEETKIDSSQYSLLVRYYDKIMVYKAYKETGDEEGASEVLTELESLESQLTEDDVLESVQYLKELFL